MQKGRCFKRSSLEDKIRENKLLSGGRLLEGPVPLTDTAMDWVVWDASLHLNFHPHSSPTCPSEISLSTPVSPPLLTYKMELIMPTRLRRML